MKRIRLISIVVAVIVLGGLAFAIFRAREPRYQGRTLSEWIGVGAGRQETDPHWQEASYAVKQMAPDAIPFLLNLAQSEDSPQKAKIIGWMNGHVPFHFHMKSASDRHCAAMPGFALLGNEAKPAWPALIQLTYSTNELIRFGAFECLRECKPDKQTFLPVLNRLINDPDRTLKIWVSEVFVYKYPQDAEAAGVYKMFPQFKKFPTKQPTTNQPPAK